MVLIDPKLYREYVRYEKGKAQLYVCMTKALGHAEEHDMIL